MSKNQTNIVNEEKLLSEDDFIVSKTDKKGHITYCNRIFVEMSGYSPKELIGANHNIIRHPDMPRIAFKTVWDLIQSKSEFFGFVKNLRKDGKFYWVFAYISADLDANGDIVSYTSFRRKPKKEAVEAIEPIYELLCDAEESGGMKESGKILTDFLAQKNMEYSEFIINLQRGLI